MAKQVEAIIKLQIKAGAANPSPPVGPALGSKGVNIMDFCKQFNARTQEQAGKIIPVIIQVYGDKSFDFITNNLLLLFNFWKLLKSNPVPQSPIVRKWLLSLGIK